jgi:hypothetical protein
VSDADDAMRYERIEPMSREDALERLKLPDGPAKARALLSLAFHDPDWRWVQNLCLDAMTNSDAGVRGTAALCLGHVARIHKQLDLDRVLPALQQLQDDPEIGWRVKDAIDDIDTFID